VPTPLGKKKNDSPGEKEPISIRGKREAPRVISAEKEGTGSALSTVVKVKIEGAAVE